MVAPELARVAANNAGRYLVVKVNTDAVPELGDRFGIRSIPTMAVFAAGESAREHPARGPRDIEAFVKPWARLRLWAQQIFEMLSKVNIEPKAKSPSLTVLKC